MKQDESQPKCIDCIYCEVLAEQGDIYRMLNPHGDEVERQYENNILICRESPPISGSFPQVSAEDWCGKFTSTSTTSNN